MVYAFVSLNILMALYGAIVCKDGIMRYIFATIVFMWSVFLVFIIQHLK